MSSVTVKDNGADALLKRARELSRGQRVRVGILDDAPKKPHEGQKPSKLSLIEIAIIHEFGASETVGEGENAETVTTPQRSFIRATVDEHRTEIQALERAFAAKMLAGEMEPEQALNQLGAAVASMVQAKIVAGIAPANAQSTIDRKKSSTPLVDTGQLKSAVTWALREGSA